MNLKKIVFKIVSVSFSMLVALIVVYGLVKLGSFCYGFGYRVFTESPMEEAPGKDVVVTVSEDMSEYEVGKLLKDKGLVRDAALFLAQLKLSAYSGKLLPGTYTLNTSMTAKEMMAVLAEEPIEDTEEEGEPSEETEEMTEAGTEDGPDEDGDAEP